MPYLAEQVLGVSAEVGFDVGEVQGCQGASRRVGVIPGQLDLSQSQHIALVFGFELDGGGELSVGSGKILTLKEFEEAQEMMSGGEVGHEGQ